MIDLDTLAGVDPVDEMNAAAARAELQATATRTRIRDLRAAERKLRTALNYLCSSEGDFIAQGFDEAAAALRAAQTMTRGALFSATHEIKTMCTNPTEENAK
jgi:formate-dependent phosphoribosylglycinamide formyltransferase (GAR transformylase)